MKTKYVILLHCAIWAGWLFINNCWAIFLWEKQPVIPVIYNNISLIVVFYSTRWVAGFYWRNIECNTFMCVNDGGDIHTRYPAKWEFYVWQKPLLGVIIIILAFICGCWLVDGLFVRLGLLPSRYPDFAYYTFVKWRAEDFYICGGNVMAAIEYHLRKEKGQRFLLEEHSRNLTEENKLLHEGVNTFLERLEKRSKRRGKGGDLL